MLNVESSENAYCAIWLNSASITFNDIPYLRAVEIKEGTIKSVVELLIIPIFIGINGVVLPLSFLNLLVVHVLCYEYFFECKVYPVLRSSSS